MSHSLLPENPVPLNNEVEARYAGKNIVMPGFAHPFAFYSQQVGTDSDCLGALDHFDPPLSPELEALDTGAKSDFFVGNNHLTPKETKKPEWKDIDSIIEKDRTDIRRQNSRILPSQPNVNGSHSQEPSESSAFSSELFSPATETAHGFSDMAIGSGFLGNNEAPLRREESGQFQERHHEEMPSDPSGEHVAPLLSHPNRCFWNQSFPPQWANNQQNYLEHASGQFWTSNNMHSLPGNWELQHDPMNDLSGIDFGRPSQMLAPFGQNPDTPSFAQAPASQPSRNRKIAAPRGKTPKVVIPEQSLVWNNNWDYIGLTGIVIHPKLEDSHSLDNPINPIDLSIPIIRTGNVPSNNEPDQTCRERKSNVQSARSEKVLARDREASKKYLKKLKEEIKELPKCIVEMAEELQQVMGNNVRMEQEVQTHASFNSDRLNSEKEKALTEVCEKWKPENRQMEDVWKRFKNDKRAEGLATTERAFFPQRFGNFLKKSLLEAEYMLKHVPLTGKDGTKASQKSRRPETLKRCELELAFSCLSFQLEKNKKVGDSLEKLLEELYPGNTTQWTAADPTLATRPYP